MAMAKEFYSSKAVAHNIGYAFDIFKRKGTSGQFCRQNKCKAIVESGVQLI